METTAHDRPAGLYQHRAATLGPLAERLAELWREPPADPFAFDLVVVPAAGVQRWLVQRLADADGICAGTRFVAPGGLDRLLRGDQPDPWAPAALVWQILRIVNERTDDERLAQLRRHLAGSRSPASACWPLASRFGGYAQWRPAMLAAWAAGADVAADGQPLTGATWQPHLWRLLVADLGLDPVTGHSELCARVADGLVELPHRVAVFAPTELSVPGLEVFAAIARQRRVDLLLLDAAPGRPAPAPLNRPDRKVWRSSARHPLNRSLGAAAEQRAALLAGQLPAEAAVLPNPPAPGTLLGWLQSDLRADLPPTRREHRPEDDSVQLHLSHGLDRQVEVLRDVLAGLFAADPSLEPRQVVVLTPDPNAVAALVTANFGLQPNGHPQHPGHQFRVQVAQRSAAQANPLVGFLVTVLGLASTRAQRSAILDLCAEPMVARRFGFTGDRLQRLVELAERAEIRWGLNPWHRAGFGVGEVAQNTWTAGLQRLLLGVALSEEHLVTARTTLPVDDVDSSDVELIGGLAELVSRLGRLLREFEQATNVAGWAERCRGAITQLVALGPEEQGWLSELSAGLQQLVRDAGDSEVTVTRPAALALLQRHFADQPARSTYGNGTLVVTGLEPLRGVPHRVVCLLGWDASRYPRPPARHRDDLRLAAPFVGDPDPALTDRQALLDAVGAATEKLIVVCAGRDATSNLAVPLAAPVADLISALDATAVAADGTGAGQAVCVQHRLQPFDPAYFTGQGRTRSYDPVALAAAAAAIGQPATAGDDVADHPRSDLRLPPLAAETVTLADLVAFYTHPVKQLVKVRTGLNLGPTEAAPEEIPLDLNGLQQWQIGDRVLRRALAGDPPEDVLRAEWLRGQVPPDQLGSRVLSGVRRKVGGLLARLPDGELATHDLSLDLGQVRVIGQVSTRGRTLLAVEFAQLSAKHKLAAWLRLLALSASRTGEWTALTVSARERAAWRGPEPEAARRLLSELIDIYFFGMSRPLPLPPGLAEQHATIRATGADPAKAISDQRKRWDSRDSDAYWAEFFDFDTLTGLPRDPEDSWGDPAEPTCLGSLAMAVWTPIRHHRVPA